MCGEIVRMEEVCERMEGSLFKTDVCEDECRWLLCGVVVVSD